MSNPIVGIVSNTDSMEKGIYKKTIHDVNEDYINMIYKHGGIPVIIPNIIDFNVIEKFLNKVDALLLIGGEDVSSECYSGKKSKNVRDEFEIKMYNYFKKNNKPIFGICRGLQIINVAEGGTLKDIDDSEINHLIGLDGWINYHDIKIINHTKLKKIIPKSNYTISSVHHQAVDKLGNSLVVSAVSNDGVIEVIESSSENFVMAFQGHIEKCLKNYDAYNNVIKKFIQEACNEKK